MPKFKEGDLVIDHEAEGYICALKVIVVDYEEFEYVAISSCLKDTEDKLYFSEGELAPYDSSEVTCLLCKASWAGIEDAIEAQYA